MKKIILLISISILILFACDSAKPQMEADSSDDKNLTENLDAYFEALKVLKKFNGGVLVQKEGKKILYKLYHMDENPASSLRLSKKSQFDIHSISKLMSQAAVVNLEEQNLINRNDNLSKYISDFPKGELITITHLIDNASGLPRGFSKDYPDLIDKTPEEIVAYIKQEPLLFEPGTERLYSNLGYQLLYFIISKVTGKPFVQFLEDEFFKPLQMKETGAHFHLSKDNLTQLVKNHELDDGILTVVPNVQRDGKNQAKLYSTLEDLLKFINHIKEEPYKTSLRDQRGEVGWSGGGDGILSHAKASLKSDYEIVFFSNYDEIPFGEILETVEKIMTNEAYELPKELNRKAIQIDRSVLEKYVGKYNVKEFNNDIFEFRIEENQLVFYQNGEKNTELNAETDSTFFEDSDSEEYFEFRPLENKGYKLIFHYKGVEIEGKK